MRERRVKKINKKRFKRQDLLNIWNVLEEEHNKVINQNNTHSRLRIRISCHDETTYESETTDCFKDGNILDIKKCNYILIQFNQYIPDVKEFYIVLQHGDYIGRIEIEGDDTYWVAGLFDKILNIIDAVSPQEHWFFKYYKIINSITAIILGFVLYSILEMVLDAVISIKPIENPTVLILNIRAFLISNPQVIYIVSFLMYWGMGFLPATYFMRWIMKSCPNLEFDFGPEHQKLEKIKRKRLIFFLSAVLIPFFINLFFKLF